MLSGQHPRIVKEYWSIDHAGDGLTASQPGKGETFIGYPYGWLEVNSTPFVSIVKNGVEIATENMMDMSRVEYLNIKRLGELEVGDRIYLEDGSSFTIDDDIMLRGLGEAYTSDFRPHGDVVDISRVYRKEAVILDKGR